jgi:hypothetical protein
MRSTNTAVVVLLLFAVSLAEVQEPTQKCNLYSESTDLYENLYKMTDGESLIIDTETSHQGSPGQIVLRGCTQFQNNKTLDLTRAKSNEVGYIVTKNAQGDQDWFPLSTNSSAASPKDTKWDFYLIKSATLALQVTGTNKSNPDLDYDLEFTMNCSQNPTKNSAAYDASKKLYTVNIFTPSICGQYFVPPTISKHQFLQAGTFAFLDRMGWPKYIIGVALCAVLLYITFFGSIYFKINLWILGFLTGWISSYIVISLILNTEETWAIWALYIIATLVGVGIAVLFSCIEKIALYGGGAFLGVCLGFELYALFIYKVDVWIGEPVMYYVSTITLGLLFLGLTYWMHNVIWICATSVGGAYLFVKCAGKMIGGYPDEVDVATEISNGDIQGMPWTHWAYLAASLVLAVVGMIFQWVHRQRTLAKQNHNMDNGHPNDNFYGQGDRQLQAAMGRGNNTGGFYDEIV